MVSEWDAIYCGIKTSIVSRSPNEAAAAASPCTQLLPFSSTSYITDSLFIQFEVSSHS